MSVHVKVDIEKVTPQTGDSFVAVHYQNPYFAAPFHRHEEYELILIREGKGLSLVGNEIRKLAKGDFMLIGANLPHLWLSSDEYYEKNSPLVSCSTYAQFGTCIFPDNMETIPEMCRIWNILRESKRGLYFHRHRDVDEAIRTFLRLPEERGVRRIISLYGILDSLSDNSKYEYMTPSEGAGISDDHSNAVIQKVMTYIDCNYNEQIMLETLANISGMHPTALCRLFKSVTGKRLFDHVSECRIENATKLLVNSNIPIKQIAFDCGYNYVSFFNKQFKHLKKMTPVEYRNMYRLSGE